MALRKERVSRKEKVSRKAKAKANPSRKNQFQFSTFLLSSQPLGLRHNDPLSYQHPAQARPSHPGQPLPRHLDLHRYPPNLPQRQHPRYLRRLGLPIFQLFDRRQCPPYLRRSDLPIPQLFRCLRSSPRQHNRPEPLQSLQPSSRQFRRHQPLNVGQRRESTFQFRLLGGIIMDLCQRE